MNERFFAYFHDYIIRNFVMFSNNNFFWPWRIFVKLVKKD
ncbi:hypothetical protein GPLA_2098 [Paraglaciecola polaris LMG 21857]|uniref:Uncharacterized protein n=1 Tax=Paraglaciecola polaris LMG 21857 TaxID=1129793 RepID=K6ZW43_9ALTE|nr:hypothetical protein GPLA_2098 [Paraglaciecola polaris LMG 21857]|tara:strand:+ start:116614 stop:116733 length:120 start_codon:yes stop_codon:yes gene_type:complete